MHIYLSTDVSIILKITRKSKSLSETTTRNQTKKQVRKTMCLLCYSTSEASCAVVQTGRHTLRLCPGAAAACSLAALLRMACVPCSLHALSLCPLDLVTTFLLLWFPFLWCVLALVFILVFSHPGFWRAVCEPRAGGLKILLASLWVVSGMLRSPEFSLGG